MVSTSSFSCDPHKGAVVKAGQDYRELYVVLWQALWSTWLRHQHGAPGLPSPFIPINIIQQAWGLKPRRKSCIKQSSVGVPAGLLGFWAFIAMIQVQSLVKEPRAYKLRGTPNKQTGLEFSGSWHVLGRDTHITKTWIQKLEALESDGLMLETRPHCLLVTRARQAMGKHL